MRYPVDYARYTAREIRKIEQRRRLGEMELSADELTELLKSVAKALDELANAVEGLQRSGWRE